MVVFFNTKNSSVRLNNSFSFVHLKAKSYCTSPDAPKSPPKYGEMINADSAFGRSQEEIYRIINEDPAKLSEQDLVESTLYLRKKILQSTEINDVAPQDLVRRESDRMLQLSIRTNNNSVSKENYETVLSKLNEMDLESRESRDLYQDLKKVIPPKPKPHNEDFVNPITSWKPADYKSNAEMMSPNPDLDHEKLEPSRPRLGPLTGRVTEIEDDVDMESNKRKYIELDDSVKEELNKFLYGEPRKRSSTTGSENKPVTGSENKPDSGDSGPSVSKVKFEDINVDANSPLEYTEISIFDSSGILENVLNFLNSLLALCWDGINLITNVITFLLSFFI
jgi:hypothetical protein